MNTTTTTIATTKNNYIPYCFESSEATHAAEKAVQNEFNFGPGNYAYATERTLFIPSNKSLCFMLNVEAFVKKLGGRRHID